MRRKCWWLTVVLCLLAGVQLAGTAQAGTAQAGTTADYTDDLLATRLVAQETGGLVPLLRLPARQLTAGEKVWLTARLAGRSDAVRMPRMAIRVDGVSSTGTQRSTIASINHDGQTHGTQYVTTRWLFTAPAAGSWTITARAEATSMLAQPDGSRPSILPVQGETYLKASPVHQASQEWLPTQSHCVGSMPVAKPDIPQCGAPVDHTVVMAKTWAKPAGTSSVTAAVELELSREYGSFPGGNGALSVTITVQPWSTSGACGSERSATYKPSISNNKHHYRLNATVPTVPLGACTHAKVSTSLTHTSGNPVGLEGPAETASYALWS